MKHKVSELEGALLDAAVAKAEGLSSVKISQGKYCMAVLDRAKSARMDVYEPSSNWSQGGPIIERERITLHAPETARPGFNWEWQAECHGTIGSDGEHFQSGTGTTPLIAAMRAYCASKFGEEVELP